MLNLTYAMTAAVTGLCIVTGGNALTPPPVSMEELNQKGIYIIEGQAPDCNINIPNLPDVIWPDLPKPEKPEAPNPPETEAPTPELPETPEQPEEETPAPELPASPAMQVINLVNAERAKEGLPALEFDAKIADAAIVRAKETEISFSHTRPNGTSFSTALKEQGISFRGAGENIAWGQRSPEEVMKAWMNSSGHRANIMNKNFTKIGVGYYQNSQGVKYWTQLFTY